MQAEYHGSTWISLAKSSCSMSKPLTHEKENSDSEPLTEQRATFQSETRYTINDG